MFLIFFWWVPPQENPKIFHTFDHLLGLCHLHSDDLSLSHLIGDIFGHLLSDGLGHHLLGDRPGHFFGDALVSSSSSCRCSLRLTALVCRSPPPPQSLLALGLGAAFSRGRSVPELCPHLALHMEVSQMRA